MATLNYARGAWELRYRDPAGASRRERFHGTSTRRPPEQAVVRKAEVGAELRDGRYVPRALRESTFGEYFTAWTAVPRISKTRA